MKARNLAATMIVGFGLVATAVAGSFSVYAQSAPLPNYYAGQVTVPSTGSVNQSAQCFSGDVINEGPLGYWLLTPSSGSLSKTGSCSAGTYNYEVEVLLGSSGYSEVTITW